MAIRGGGGTFQYKPGADDKDTNSNQHLVKGGAPPHHSVWGTNSGYVHYVDDLVLLTRCTHGSHLTFVDAQATNAQPIQAQQDMQAALAHMYPPGQAPQYSGQEGMWQPNPPAAMALLAPLATDPLHADHDAHRPLSEMAQGSAMTQGSGYSPHAWLSSLESRGPTFSTPVALANTFSSPVHQNYAESLQGGDSKPDESGSE